MPSIYRRSGTVPISGFIVTLVLLLVVLSITVYATYWIWRFARTPSSKQDPPDTSAAAAAIPAPSPFSYLDQRPLATPVLFHTPSNPIKTTLQPSEPRRPSIPPRSRPSPPLSRPTPPQPRQKKAQPRPNPSTTNRNTHPKSRPPTPPLRNPNRPPPLLPSISAPAGTGSTGLTQRLPSPTTEHALTTYIRSLTPSQLDATARGDGTTFFVSGSSPIPGGASSSVAGSEMSNLPTNAAFAAEFARREQRLREQGLVGRGWALVMSEGGSVGGEGGESVSGGGGRVVEGEEGKGKGKEVVVEDVPKRALGGRREGRGV